MKKDQTSILGLNNTMNEMQNVIETINSRTDQSEDRNLEIIQSEENKGKRM